MKLYDFDGMFDEKIAEHLKKNPTKYTEEEWEDAIPALYEKFGNTPNKAIGCTPYEFFAAMSTEDLIKALKLYLSKGISVPKFLRVPLEKRDDRYSFLLEMLNGTEQEIFSAAEILGAEDSAMPKYLQLFLRDDFSSEDKEFFADLLKRKSDLVKDGLLEVLPDQVDPSQVLEILSCCVVPDDKIYQALVRAFQEEEDTALYASYLATYGDERAVEVLKDKIQTETSYVVFRELKYAIEALGGDYEDDGRDFSSDPSYQAVQEHEKKMAELFEKAQQQEDKSKS